MKRALLLVLLAGLTVGVVLPGCTRSPQSKRPGGPGTVRSSVAADWPTGASVDATVAVLMPAAPAVDDADVTGEVFGDGAGAERLAGLLGSTLFYADMPEPRQYLTAVAHVVGSARSSEGVDVYVALYEQWWRMGASGPEKTMASSGPAVLRLHNEGSGFELSGVDRPGDGSLHAPGLAALFPAWARGSVERVRRGSSARYEAITNAAAMGWSGSSEP